MPYTMGGEMTGWMMLMFLIPVLLIGLVALAFAWAIRSSRAPADAPVAILQRRYARGDIGADEYQRIRAALTAD